VIISGGHKGQRQGALGIAVALWRKGFNVILYSYRGMPGSDRAPITFGIKEVLELQAAIAFARKRIPNARIGLLGYSMGAVVSLLGAAGEPGVQALVLDSPFSELRKLLIENVRSASKLPGTPFVWLAGLMFWVRTRCTISACSPIDVLSSLEPRPLFFIHGGADSITNVNHTPRLYHAYARSGSCRERRTPVPTSLTGRCTWSASRGSSRATWASTSAAICDWSKRKKSARG
jgi:dipeptidyl aminopeptidase/acylaminoacyl peptidase